MKKVYLLLVPIFLLFWGVSCSIDPDVPETLEILVLDSLDGSPVENVEVSLYIAGEDERAFICKTDSKGIVTICTAGLYLAGYRMDQEFDIVAEKDDLASSKIQGFSFDSGYIPVLYCHKQMMISYEAEAPTITKVEYSVDKTIWNNFDGEINSSDLKFIRVTANAKTEIKETGWCGFGVKVAISQDINRWDGISAEYFEKEGVQIGDTGLYETIGVYDLSSTDYMSDDYFLNVVAYDVVANRVQQKIDFSIVSDVSNTDPSLKEVKPVISEYLAKTYGVSREYYGADTHNGLGTSYYIELDVTVDAGVRRIDIFRSEDDENYSLLEKNISLPNVSTEAGTHTYSDFDATVVMDKTYYYKVVAYNNSADPSMESDPVSFKLMPPHNTNLTLPADFSKTTSVTPNFTFSVTNPVILDENVASDLNFQLWIRNKLNPILRYTIEWDRVNNQVKCNNRLYDEASIFSEDTANQTITINYSAFGDTLEVGKTYEWNVIGASHGSYFGNKYFNEDGVLLGEVQSLASHSANGQGALNGHYTLTITDNAE